MEENEPLCGRILGIRKFENGLILNDAYFGLMRIVDLNDFDNLEIVPLSNSFNSVPFKFTNDLDIDYTSNLIYFTVSSEDFERRNVMNEIFQSTCTGRIFVYDLNNNITSLFKDQLCFANGIQLYDNYLFVAETTRGRVSKINLKTKQIEKKFELLHGLPDNIRIYNENELWIGFGSKFNSISMKMSEKVNPKKKN